MLLLKKRKSYQFFCQQKVCSSAANPFFLQNTKTPPKKFSAKTSNYKIRTKYIEWAVDHVHKTYYICTYIHSHLISCKTHPPLTRKCRDKSLLQQRSFLLFQSLHVHIETRTGPFSHSTILGIFPRPYSHRAHIKFPIVTNFKRHVHHPL